MKGSVRARGKNSWQLSIDLGRDASGKRLRKYVTVQGPIINRKNYIKNTPEYYNNNNSNNDSNNNNDSTE